MTLTFSCSRLNARSSTPIYMVDAPTVKTFISSEIESEKRSSAFNNTEKDTSTTKERIEIRTKGWLYHPALLTFNVGLIPEFKQQSIDIKPVDSLGQENDASFHGYFIDSTFLQYKPYTLNLYANKNRSDFASSLASDNVTESSTNRAQLFLSYQPVPTTFTYESQDKVTESLFVTSEKSKKTRVDLKHQNKISKTTVEAEVLKQDRVVRNTSFGGERSYMYFNNHLKIGEVNSLSTGLRFSENTSGVVDSSASNFNSQLMLRHHRKLKTRYHLRLEERDEGVFTSEKRYGAFELTHKLYENLTTRLNADIDKSEFTEGKLDIYGTGIDFHYDRRISWGHINVNLGHSERIEDNQRQLAFAGIRDEPHVLTGTDLELLVNDTIDDNSIVVTDATGLPYAIGIDYIVTVVDTSVFISRNAAGGITDGETVLVDYSFEADPPSKTANIADRFGVNLNLFSKLELYYQNNQTREKLISGNAPSILTDDSVRRTGAKLRWNWSTTNVEFEKRDRVQTPTKRFKFSETILFRPAHNMSFGFDATYYELDVIDTGESSESKKGTFNFQWNIISAGQLSADGFSEKVTGTVQRAERKGLKILYKWNYGSWRPSIRYALSDENDQLVGDARKRSNIYFKVSRVF